MILPSCWKTYMWWPLQLSQNACLIEESTISCYVSNPPHFPLAGSFCGTPLHHAAKKGLEQTVHLLLTHGGIPWSIYMKCFIHLSWILVVLLSAYSCSQSFHTKWWLQYCPWIGKRKGPCECCTGHRGMLCTGCPTVHVVLMEKYSFWLFHIFLI